MTITLLEPQLGQYGFSLTSHLALTLQVLNSLVVVNSCARAECVCIHGQGHTGCDLLKGTSTSTKR